MSWGSVVLIDRFSTRNPEIVAPIWVPLAISDDIPTSGSAAALALPYDLLRELAGSHPAESTHEVRVSSSLTGGLRGIVTAFTYAPLDYAGEPTEGVECS